MITLHPLTTDSCNLLKAAKLYETAFPLTERRSGFAWMQQISSSPLFHPYEIRLSENFAGIITLWDFDTFVYIEHFATLPEMRGKGVGSESLKKTLTQCQSRPIVLEVEHPDNEIARRRIGFYERNGLCLVSTPEAYIQPPYEAEGEWLPLCLMSSKANFAADSFFHIREKLYTEVYKVNI